VTRVKICGLTSIEDALAAAEAGADFLGFVFAAGPRRLEPEAAAGFWARLPRGVSKVAVFRDQSVEEVERVLALLVPDYLQFHGAERPAFCRLFGLPVIRAIPATAPADLALATGYADAADLFLVDLPKEGAAGALPLEVARAAALLPKPALLAGGLGPKNVGALVAACRPFGVDVARGVESAPGRKDHDKVRAFVRNAKEAA
jgi:phosphoribosylanthranilate isomerase